MKVLDVLIAASDNCPLGEIINLNLRILLKNSRRISLNSKKELNQIKSTFLAILKKSK
jgi:hypothetical protein